MTNPTCRDIIAATAAIFGIPVKTIVGECRSRDVIDVRWVTIYACVIAGHSLATTGRAINRDHTSVWHALNKMRVKGLNIGDYRVLAQEVLDCLDKKSLPQRAVAANRYSSLFMLLSNDNDKLLGPTAPPELLDYEASDFQQHRIVRRSTDRLVAALRAAHGELENCSKNGRGTA